ncbi:YccT family protein [Aliagarivorans marinus]|uniref:YccT family protein n=1 Tax=Aliagarivorans marinus TaxID=561965 RepID=UPI00047EDA8D|nr:DUF2057 domain-containing protein [Aliagarivorans marinus]
MHLFTKAMTAAVAALASAQLAAASFSVPTNFELLYVDKEKVSSFFTSKSKVDLDGGVHQVVVRYRDTVGGSDNSEVISSGPIVINLELSADQDIVLKGDSPRTVRKAEEYAKKPRFSVSDKRGGQVRHEYYHLPLKPGFQLNRDYLEEIAAYETQNASQIIATPAGAAAAPKPKAIQPAAAATTAAATTAVAAAPAASTPAVTSTSNTTEMEMLTFWFNKASVDTRKQIQVWAITGEAPEAAGTEMEMLQFWYGKADEATRKQFQVWAIQQ